MINEAKVACTSQGHKVEEVFTDVGKNPTAKGGRPGSDYRLTRFACYMIALSADGTKERVAAAKVYFAVMTRQQEELLVEVAHKQEELRELMAEVGDDPLIEVAQRILLRQELTEAHKRLMARARDAGVITPLQCARFVNWGYKGLYPGETEDDIHARRGLAPREEISNWMGAIETMANVLRAVIAEKRMEIQGDRTPREANRTHYLAGQAVRKFLMSEGIYPEQLPIPTKSYKQIVKEEAARIAREEEDARGLWANLPAPPETEGEE